MRQTDIPDKDIPTADPEAVIIQYTPLIIKISTRYKPVLERTGAVDIDDLVQAGRIAVCHAQKRYDPAGGASFITYAFYWIRNAMHRTAGIKNTGELPEILLSLDEPIEEGSDILRGDLIPDKAPTAEERTIEQDGRQETAETVRAAVDELKNPKQREIVDRVYFREQERKQAAAEMNVSYGVANAIEHQALTKLKKNHNLQQLVNYKRIGLSAFRYLWSSEEEDFLIRQEKAYDEIHGAGAYVASFRRGMITE